MTKDEREFVLSNGKECRACLEEIKAILAEDLIASFNALKELDFLIRFDDDENEYLYQICKDDKGNLFFLTDSDEK